MGWAGSVDGREQGQAQPPGLVSLPLAPREAQACTVPCPFLPSTGKQKGSQSLLQREGFFGTGLMMRSELSFAQRCTMNRKLRVCIYFSGEKQVLRFLTLVHILVLLVTERAVGTGRKVLRRDDRRGPGGKVPVGPVCSTLWSKGARAAGGASSLRRGARRQSSCGPEWGPCRHAGRPVGLPRC